MDKHRMINLIEDRGKREEADIHILSLVLRANVWEVSFINI